MIPRTSEPTSMIGVAVHDERPEPEPGLGRDVARHRPAQRGELEDERRLATRDEGVRAEAGPDRREPDEQERGEDRRDAGERRQRRDHHGRPRRARREGDEPGGDHALAAAAEHARPVDRGDVAAGRRQERDRGPPGQAERAEHAVHEHGRAGQVAGVLEHGEQEVERQHVRDADGQHRRAGRRRAPTAGSWTRSAPGRSRARPSRGTARPSPPRPGRGRRPASHRSR